MGGAWLPCGEGLGVMDVLVVDSRGERAASWRGVHGWGAAMRSLRSGLSAVEPAWFVVVVGGQSASVVSICSPYLASLFSPTPFTLPSSPSVVGCSVAIWRSVASWKIT